MTSLILVLIIVESLVIALFFVSRKRRMSTVCAYIGTQFSGLFLILALHGALLDWRWQWVALWLTAALLAHICDLAWRIRER